MKRTIGIIASTTAIGLLLTGVFYAGYRKRVPEQCKRLLICNDGFMIYHNNSLDNECSDHGGSISSWSATRVREGKHWRIVLTPAGETPDDVFVAAVEKDKP